MTLCAGKQPPAMILNFVWGERVLRSQSATASPEGWALIGRKGHIRAYSSPYSCQIFSSML